MENLGTLGFSEEQADLLDGAARFCADKSPMETVRKLMASDAGFDEGVWKEIGELGWLGVAIPEEFGGVGLTLAEVAPIMESMGRSMLTGPFFATTLAGQAILAGGSEDQKSALLPEIAAGAAASLALSEPGGGWDLGAIATTATRDGDGFRLSGAKTFIMDGRAARLLVLSAMLDGAPVLFFVNSDAIPGEAWRRETIIDETKRSYALSLNGVRVSKDSLAPPEKAGAALAHIDLAANLLASAEMTGACAACIDYTLDYLRTRKQFGRAIGSYQALKHPSVDIYTEYEQARSHLYAAAHSFNDQGAGEVATRMAKAQALKTLSFASDRSIQFHGGFGFTYDCDAQLYRRRAAWHASQFGDEAHQRRRLAELLF
ncbi:MAG: acyl-CoA dehydrogenase family protein [Pseudomonadota bacterium]